MAALPRTVHDGTEDPLLPLLRCLADRGAVMLGTLRGEQTDETREERAMVGEEADNVLVVMVTQLVQPFLGGFDARTEDVEANRPF